MKTTVTHTHTTRTRATTSRSTFRDYSHGNLTSRATISQRVLARRSSGHQSSLVTSSNKHYRANSPPDRTFLRSTCLARPVSRGKRQIPGARPGDGFVSGKRDQFASVTAENPMWGGLFGRPFANNKWSAVPVLPNIYTPPVSLGHDTQNDCPAAIPDRFKHAAAARTSGTSSAPA